MGKLVDATAFQPSLPHCDPPLCTELPLAEPQRWCHHLRQRLQGSSVVHLIGRPLARPSNTAALPVCCSVIQTAAHGPAQPHISSRASLYSSDGNQAAAGGRLQLRSRWRFGLDWRLSCGPSKPFLLRNKANGCSSAPGPGFKEGGTPPLARPFADSINLCHQQ